MVESSPAGAGDTRDVKGVGLIPGSGRSLEEGQATHSSILAWRIPWTKEPGGLQPRGHTESDTTEATWHTCLRVALKESYYDRR